MRHTTRTKGPLVLLVLLLSAGASPVRAQHETPSPYAGQQGQEIKSLSPEEQEALLSGSGMGWAKAAELNGYPGPRHVLDLGDSLGLTAVQRDRTERLFASMQAEARRLGALVVEKERALDALLAAGRAGREDVYARLVEIGRLQGELRAVHIQAHLAMREVLAPEQVAAYARLRGYAVEAAPASHHHHD